MLTHFSNGGTRASLSRLDEAPVNEDGVLVPFYDSAVFDRLRARTRAMHTPSIVTLVTIGNESEYSARANYCANFFNAAGIASVRTDASLTDHANPKPELAVICSTDKHLSLIHI